MKYRSQISDMQEGKMKKTIVAFGDSNTHGYCSQTGGRFSEEERSTLEMNTG